MKTTLTLSSSLNCNLFAILDEDVDDVIMVINFYIIYGEQDQSSTQTEKSAEGKKERIRVTDKTATGGWF
jgi:hypothetical protein